MDPPTNHDNAKSDTAGTPLREVAIKHESPRLVAENELQISHSMRDAPTAPDGHAPDMSRLASSVPTGAFDCATILGQSRNMALHASSRFASSVPEQSMPIFPLEVFGPVRLDDRPPRPVGEERPQVAEEAHSSPVVPSRARFPDLETCIPPTRRSVTGLGASPLVSMSWHPLEQVPQEEPAPGQRDGSQQQQPERLQETPEELPFIGKSNEKSPVQASGLPKRLQKQSWAY